jgi:hypothetical protein
MKRAERDSKLKRGLKAYADSVEAGGTLRGFRNRLRNWPVYAAAAGSALALSTSAMADILSKGGLDTQTVAFGGNTFSVGFQGSQSGSRTGTHFGGFRWFINSFGRATLNGNGLFLGLPFPAGFPVNTHSPGGSFSGPHLLKQGHYFQFFSLSLGPFGPTVEFSRRTSHTGLWNGTAYAPIKLTNGDLGWLKIAVPNSAHGVPVGVDILAWAYNDVAGQPILTGQTTVPEPSSLALALLAAGSVGVLAFRRRRNAAASQPVDSVK